MIGQGVFFFFRISVYSCNSNSKASKKERVQCLAAPQMLPLLINIHCIMLCILPSTWITVEKSSNFIPQSAATGMPASRNLDFKFANLYTGQRAKNVQRMQMNAAWRVFAFLDWIWKFNVKCRFMQQWWLKSQNSNRDYLSRCE